MSSASDTGRSEDKTNVDSFYEFGQQVSIDDYWLPTDNQQEQPPPSAGRRRSLSCTDQDTAIAQGTFLTPSFLKTPLLL